MSQLRLAQFVSIIALTLGAAVRVLAATITVGFPAGNGQPCDFDNIQAALAYANSNGDPVNEVRLMYASGINGFPFVGQSNSLTLDAAKEVTITGGYGSCTQTVADSGVTEIKGLNDPPNFSGTGTVLSIHAGAGSSVRLRLLKIWKGKTAVSDAGGGVYYSGDGTLDIADCEIFSNTSGYGGGIYAEGNGGTNAKLLIGSNVHVFSNGAAYYGGGIRIAGLEMTMNGSGSYITQNNADANLGDGGGLAITGHAGQPGKATVSGTGNAISNNSAHRGGGVAVMANNDDGETATLVLRSGLVGNFAYYRGGGIFARPEVLSLPERNIAASVFADTSAKIDNNSAPDGAAVYLDYAENYLVNYGAGFSMTTDSISGNASEDQFANPTSGAIVHAGDATILNLTRVVLRGNHGGPILSNDSVANLKNVLIAGNTTSGSLIVDVGSDSLTRVYDSTIATNTIGGAYVLSQSDDFELKRVIFDQPGKTILQHNGGTVTVENVMSTEEVASLNAGAQAFVAAPRFVDAGGGDYELQAASPAVDRAPADAAEAVDLLGRPHNVDLPFKVNSGGPRDLGAFERQSLQPLVLNGDFDVNDLRHWTMFAGGWDATNITGAAGSGSVAYSAPSTNGTHVVVAQQCIFLPGPGSYVINGWGHTSGATVDSRDYARLGWEFRYDGYDVCTNGTPSASGEFTLGHGTAWTQAGTPAVVNVFDWSRNSSITLYLIAAAGTLTTARTIHAWFDGITIGVQPLDDLIFSDGFN
jgi:hypothetical protein